MGRVPRAASLAVVFACACGDAGAFACLGDAQCAGAGGICQPDGWCSFPADACPSGQRYGEHAGGGLGGTCVPDGNGSTGAASGSGDGNPSGPSPTGPSLDTGELGSSTTTMPVVDDDTGPTPGTTSGSGSGDGESDGSASTGAASDPSLVAWYTFDDPTDLFADASGNGLHGYCGQSDCPLWQAGILDGAIRLDGIDDHFHVMHSRLFELTDELTVAVWVNVDSVTTSYHAIVGKPLGSETDNSWEIGAANDPLFYFGGGSSTQGSSVESLAFELGTWHHLAMTVGGNELRAFVDGALVGTTAIVELEYDGHTLIVGADIDFGSDSNFFQGAIDDVRIYDRPLDDAEVAALAASG
jgi:hypothetical protein